MSDFLVFVSVAVLFWVGVFTALLWMLPAILAVPVGLALMVWTFVDNKQHG